MDSVEAAAAGETWPNLEQFGAIDLSVLSDSAFGVADLRVSEGGMGVEKSRKKRRMSMVWLCVRYGVRM